MGLGQAVKNLGAQFASLEKMLGPVGLILAAYASWKKVVDAVRTAHEQLSAGIRQTQLQNIEARIRRTAEAYDTERESVERLADARRRLSDVEQAKDDARLRADLAALELERLQSRAELDPEDSLGARKVDQAYAERAAGLQEGSERRRAERETTKLAASLSDVMSQFKETQKTISDLEKSYNALSVQRSNVFSQAMTKSDAAWTDSGRTLIWNAAAKELDQIVKAMDGVVKKLEPAYANLSALQTDRKELGGMREAADIDRRTIDTRSAARQTSDYMSALEIARADNARLQEMLDQLANVMAQRGAAERNAISAILDNARNSGRLAETVEQILPEMTRRVQAAESRARRPGG